MEYYSAIENNKTLPFATMADGHRVLMLSEISHTEKDKYSMLLLICRI